MEENKNIALLLSDCFFSQRPLSEVLTQYEIHELVCHIDPELRGLMAKALMFDTMGSNTVKYLSQLSEDNDVIVRLEAVDSLGAYICQESFMALRKALCDEDELIRAYAAYGMASIGRILLETEATSILHKIEERECSDLVRASIYQGLYMLGESKALEKLILLFHVDEYHVQCSVLRALRDVASSENKSTISMFIDSLNIDKYPIAVMNAYDELLTELSGI